MTEAKLNYQISVKNLDDAIDIKNKILINTTDKEMVEIKIYVESDY